MTAAAVAIAQKPLQIEFLPVDGIRPSGFNPRKTFSAVDELAANIKQHGIKVPLRVRPIAKTATMSAHYELVFGERRWRAAKKAGIDQVPAIVEDMDDSEALQLMLVELAQTSDVHPVEEAEAYRTLHQKHGLTVEEIALRVGKSKRVVYERMQLCVLAEAVKKAALEGKLSTSHAVLIARIPAQFQDAALKKMLEDGMNIEKAREFVLREYTLGLADAPWDLKDAGLVPAAGACSSCPKRTGNQPELFADVAKKDTCTDPACFSAKKKASVALTLKKAADEGKPVTTAAEAKKAVKSGEYVDLDEKKFLGDRYQSYREALGKKKLEVTLAPAPEGVQELVRKEDVEKLLGKKKPEPPAHDWKKEDEKRRAERAKKYAVAAGIVADVAKKAVSKSLGKAVWFVVASALLEQEMSNDDAEALCRTLLQREPSENDYNKDLADAQAAAAKMNAEQLQGLVVTIVAAGAVWPYVNNGKGALAELASVLGVDEKKIAERVKLELKAAGKPGHAPPEPGVEPVLEKKPAPASAVKPAPKKAKAKAAKKGKKK